MAALLPFKRRRYAESHSPILNCTTEGGVQLPFKHHRKPRTVYWRALLLLYHPKMPLRVTDVVTFSRSSTSTSSSRWLLWKSRRAKCRTSTAVLLTISMRQTGTLPGNGCMLGAKSRLGGLDRKFYFPLPCQTDVPTMRFKYV